MNMRKQRILAILLFILYLCAVAYCCFGRFKDLPQIGQSFTTYRSGDPMDFLADFTALASTSVITLLAELLIFKNKR